VVTKDGKTTTVSKVVQKIVKHIGVAFDEAGLEELKLLAKGIKTKLEMETQLPLYTPEELEALSGSNSTESTTHTPSSYPQTSTPSHTPTHTPLPTQTPLEEKREDYSVNLLDIVEEKRVIRGIHDVYGKLYHEMGFGKVIPNPARNSASIKALQEIVLARIANPQSKRGSVNTLASEFGVDLDLKLIYRMMDKLDDGQILKLNTLVLNQTKSLLDDTIDIIYFDATTLYFESFTEDSGEDGIKKNGYSKDGKFNQPQVVLALLVTKQGLPIGYKAFSGDTFDGHTLIPSLQDAAKEFKVDKIVYVADSGMFNTSNLEAFEKYPNFTYILGARIKSMKKDIQQKILSQDDFIELSDDIIMKTIDYDGKKLLVTYSKTRAAKDKFERDKAIAKLKGKLEKSTSLKSQLSNNGYKKYLLLEETTKENKEDKENKENKEDKEKPMASKKKSCDISIRLNEEKIKEDEQWDGLKGVITNNTTLTNEELLSQYSNLWQVEESFRITKHDLKIRPIYHWKPSRIKAHLAISFMAYALVRHLEYRVRVQYKKLSPQRIRETLLAVQTSTLYDTKQNKKFLLPSRVSSEAKKIYRVMGLTPQTTPKILR